MIVIDIGARWRRPDAFGGSGNGTAEIRDKDTGRHASLQHVLNDMSLDEVIPNHASNKENTCYCLAYPIWRAPPKAYPMLLKVLALDVVPPAKRTQLVGQASH